jgi:hypothetical protein
VTSEPAPYIIAVPLTVVRSVELENARLAMQSPCGNR